MANSTTVLSDDEVAQKRMRSFFSTLSEKDQRRYAALEAQRRGHGGMKAVAEMFGCSTKTISRGIEELDTLDQDPAVGRVRRPGGGRKKRLPPPAKSSKN